MATKAVSKKASSISIEGAVALHLATIECCTKPQPLELLLEEVKKMVANKRLTVRSLEVALWNWIQNEWVKFEENFLTVTRAGRAKIKQFAEAAVASPAT